MSKRYTNYHFVARTVVFPLGAMLLLLTGGCSQQPSALNQIKQKGELVVVTRNSPTTYFEGPYGPTGLEYDLVSLFADYLGVDLKLITTANFNAILPMVAHRDAHLAAAGLTITEARKSRVRFGPPYQNITEQLVYRSGTRQPQDPEDLVDTSLEVIAGSSHAERLSNLTKYYKNLTWQENNDVESEELLSLVWEKKIDYTVADSNEVALNQRYYPELRVAFDLSRPQQLAWAFPKGPDNSLYNEAVKFFNHIKQSGKLDQLLDRYYGHVQDFDYVGTRLFMKHIEERLPDYIQNFKQAAQHNNMDWRLLAAIGYQESHWNPRAISPTGVRGIMMLTRTTAADMGFTNRIDPQNSIKGGARYFRLLKNRLPRDINEPDRTWFALAAYNIGFGHVEDARTIIRQRGGDPDKWVDVKESLPLLTQKRWYEQLPHGYARGNEALRYVENIRSYYDILVWQTEPNKLKLPNTPIKYPITISQYIPSPIL